TEGNAFSGVLHAGYWSSTTLAVETSNAWYVYFYAGDVPHTGKTATLYVWPVRGGE
ncbi:MAG: DUF1566 domain-containing protein, partial [Candidatus Parabeggiatoa sp. nov. 1]